MNFECNRDLSKNFYFFDIKWHKKNSDFQLKREKDENYVLFRLLYICTNVDILIKLV